ncbi:MAG: hypothetical protein Q4G04_05540 [bacterium]|nr:hypothetical protein [bacterium]
MDYLENIMQKEIDREKMLRSDDYFAWLELYTSVYGNFSDCEDDFRDIGVDEFDLKNINKLIILFEILLDNVDDCKCWHKTDFGGYYIVEYNDVYYKIGIMVGQGGLCYCKLVTKDELPRLIHSAVYFGDVRDKCLANKTLKKNL